MNDYLSDKDLKSELKLILKNVDIFLKDNNIEYSIIAGTLLGAIRHEGFIPWDDDIDICLIRSEYNKLVEILKKNQVSDNLYGIGYELNNSDIPFIKIVNKDISCIEKFTLGKSEIKYETNLWIDVFPIDAIPKKNINLYFFYLRKILFKIYNFKRESIHKWNVKRNPLKTCLLNIIKFILNIISFNRILEKYISTCSKYDINNCDLVCGNTWGIGYAEAFPKEVMFEYADYKFEDIIVKGIKNYDIWLKIRYGEYLELPPESKRVNHGIIAWRVDKNEK